MDGIKIPVTLDIVLSSLSSLKLTLNNLKPDSKGWKEISNIIHAMEKEADRLLVTMSKPFTSLALFNTAEKSIEKMDEALDKAALTMSRLKFSDLKLTPEQLATFDSFKQLLNELTKDILEFKVKAKAELQLSEKWDDIIKLDPNAVTHTFDEILKIVRKKNAEILQLYKEALRAAEDYLKLNTAAQYTEKVFSKANPLKEGLDSDTFNRFFELKKGMTDEFKFKTGQKDAFYNWVKENFTLTDAQLSEIQKTSGTKMAELFKGFKTEALLQALSVKTTNADKTLLVNDLAAQAASAGSAIEGLGAHVDILTLKLATLKLSTAEINGVINLHELALTNAARGSEDFGNSQSLMRSALESLKGTLSSANTQFILMQRTQLSFNLMKMAVVNFMGFNLVLNLTKNAIRNAINHIQELDSVMNKISIVTDMSTADLWNLVDAYSQMALAYGVSIKGAYEVSLIYYQQGLQTNDVLTLTNETLKLARISGLDYALTTDYMTTALRGFKMEMSEASTVVDVYSNLASHTAVSLEELAVAMSKTASSMEGVGATFEEASAMIATMVAVTRESATNIGSAMKSIASRYGELTKDPMKLIDDEGEVMAFNKVDAALQSVGISMKTADGQFREFTDVIIELGEKWNELESVLLRYIATLFAGNRQQSRFLALVSNVDLLKSNLDYAENSEDTGTLLALKALDSIEAKIELVRVAYQLFYTTVGIEDVWKGLLDGTKNVINTLNGLPKLFGKIPLGAIAAISSIVSLIKSLGIDLLNTFALTFGLSMLLGALLAQSKALEGAQSLIGIVLNTIKSKKGEFVNAGKESALAYTLGILQSSTTITPNQLTGQARSTYDNNLNIINAFKAKTALFSVTGDALNGAYAILANQMRGLPVEILDKINADESLAKLLLEEYIASLEKTNLKLLETGNTAELSGGKLKNFIANHKNLGQGLQSFGSALNMIAMTINTTAEGGKTLSGTLLLVAGTATLAGIAIKGILAALLLTEFSVPWLAIVSGAMMLINGISTLIVTQEERIEELTKKAEELNNLAKEAKANYRTLDNSIKKLDELKEKRHESAEAAEEYLTAVDELTEKFPQMIAGFDEAGNIILDTASAEKILADARKKTLEATYEAAKGELAASEQKRASAYNTYKGTLNGLYLNSSNIAKESTTNADASRFSFLLDLLNTEFISTFDYNNLETEDLEFVKIARDLINEMSNADFSLEKYEKFIQRFNLKEILQSNLQWIESLIENLDDIEEKNKLQSLLLHIQSILDQFDNFTLNLSEELIAPVDDQIALFKERINEKLKILNGSDFNINSEESNNLILELNELFIEAEDYFSLDTSGFLEEAAKTFTLLKNEIGLYIDEDAIYQGNKKLVISAWLQEAGSWSFLSESASGIALMTKEISSQVGNKDWSNMTEDDKTNWKNLADLFETFWKSLSDERKNLFNSMMERPELYTGEDILKEFSTVPQQLINKYFTESAEEVRDRLQLSLSKSMGNNFDKLTGRYSEIDKNTNFKNQFYKDFYDLTVLDLTSTEESILNNILNQYNNLSKNGYKQKATDFGETALRLFEQVNALDSDISASIWTLIRENGLTTLEGIQNIRNGINNNKAVAGKIDDNILLTLYNNIIPNINLEILTMISNLLETWEDTSKELSSAMNGGVSLKEADELILKASSLGVDISLDNFTLVGDKLILATDYYNQYYLALKANSEAQVKSILSAINAAKSIGADLRDAAIRLGEFLNSDKYKADLEAVGFNWKEASYWKADGTLSTDGIKALEEAIENNEKGLANYNRAALIAADLLMNALDRSQGIYKLHTDGVELLFSELKNIAQGLDLNGKKLSKDAVSERAIKESINSVYNTLVSDVLSKGFKNINLDDYEGLIQSDKNILQHYINEGDYTKFIERYALMAGSSIDEINELLLQAQEKSREQFSEDLIKDFTFTDKDTFRASYDSLVKLANAYDKGILELIDAGKIDFDATTLQYIMSVSQISKFGIDLSKIDYFNETVQESIDSLFSGLTSDVQKALEGKIDAKGVTQLRETLSALGLNEIELDFTKTAEGLKLTDNAFFNLYNSILKFDKAGKKLLTEFTKTSKLYQSLGDVLREYEKITTLAGETLKAVLKEIAAVMLRNPDNYNLMNGSMLGPWSAADNFWGSGSKAFKVVNTMATSGKVSAADFSALMQSIIDNSLIEADRQWALDMLFKAPDAFYENDGTLMVNTAAMRLKNYLEYYEIIKRSYDVVREGGKVLAQLFNDLYFGSESLQSALLNSDIYSDGALHADKLKVLVDKGEQQGQNIKTILDKFTIKGLSLYDSLSTTDGDLAKWRDLIIKLLASTNWDWENIEELVEQLLGEAGLGGQVKINDNGQYELKIIPGQTTTEVLYEVEGTELTKAEYLKWMAAKAKAKENTEVTSEGENKVLSYTISGQEIKVVLKADGTVSYEAEFKDGKQTTIVTASTEADLLTALRSLGWTSDETTVDGSNGSRFVTISGIKYIIKSDGTVEFDSTLSETLQAAFALLKADLEALYKKESEENPLQVDEKIDILASNINIALTEGYTAKLVTSPVELTDSISTVANSINIKKSQNFSINGIDTIWNSVTLTHEYKDPFVATVLELLIKLGDKFKKPDGSTIWDVLNTINTKDDVKFAATVIELLILQGKDFVDPDGNNIWLKLYSINTKDNELFIATVIDLLIQTGKHFVAPDGSNIWDLIKNIDTKQYPLFEAFVQALVTKPGTKDGTEINNDNGSPIWNLVKEEPATAFNFIAYVASLTTQEDTSNFKNDKGETFWQTVEMNKTKDGFSFEALISILTFAGNAIALAKAKSGPSLEDLSIKSSYHSSEAIEYVQDVKLTYNVEDDKTAEDIIAARSKLWNNLDLRYSVNKKDGFYGLEYWDSLDSRTYKNGYSDTNKLGWHIADNSKIASYIDSLANLVAAGKVLGEVDFTNLNTLLEMDIKGDPGKKIKEIYDAATTNATDFSSNVESLKELSGIEFKAEALSTYSEAISKIATALQALNSIEWDKIINGLNSLDSELISKEPLKVPIELKPNGNVNLNSRPYISPELMKKAGWLDFDGDYATLFSNTMTSSAESEILVTVGVTPITEDGRVLSPEALDSYVYDYLFGNGTNTVEDIIELDKKGLNILIDIQKGSSQEDIEAMDNKLIAIHEDLEQIYNDPLLPEIDSSELDELVITLTSILNLINTISSSLVNLNTSGDGSATGNALAEGNVLDLDNIALAAGRKTLMGELGPEMYVSNGHYYVAGLGGAEMVDLPEDAIVFNHILTRSLLKNGKATRGKAVVNERIATGMAHASGFDNKNLTKLNNGYNTGITNVSVLLKATQALSGAANKLTEAAKIQIEAAEELLEAAQSTEKSTAQIAHSLVHPGSPAKYAGTGLNFNGSSTTSATYGKNIGSLGAGGNPLSVTWDQMYAKSSTTYGSSGLSKDAKSAIGNVINDIVSKGIENLDLSKYEKLPNDLKSRILKEIESGQGYRQFVTEYADCLDKTTKEINSMYFEAWLKDLENLGESEDMMSATEGLTFFKTGMIGGSADDWTTIFGDYTKVQDLVEAGVLAWNKNLRQYVISSIEDLAAYGTDMEAIANLSDALTDSQRETLEDIQNKLSEAIKGNGLKAAEITKLKEQWRLLGYLDILEFDANGKLTAAAADALKTAFANGSYYVNTTVDSIHDVYERTSEILDKIVQGVYVSETDRTDALNEVNRALGTSLDANSSVKEIEEVYKQYNFDAYNLIIALKLDLDNADKNKAIDILKRLRQKENVTNEDLLWLNNKFDYNIDENTGNDVLEKYIYELNNEEGKKFEATLKDGETENASRAFEIIKKLYEGLRVTAEDLYWVSNVYKLEVDENTTKDKLVEAALDLNETLNGEVSEWIRQNTDKYYNNIKSFGDSLINAFNDGSIISHEDFAQFSSIEGIDINKYDFIKTAEGYLVNDFNNILTFYYDILDKAPVAAKDFLNNFINAIDITKLTADQIASYKELAKSAQKNNTIKSQEYDSLMASIDDAIMETLDLVVSYISNGLSGTLKNADIIDLLNKLKFFGVDIALEFEKTEKGLKLATSSAIEFYYELKKVDALQAELVFDELRKSLEEVNDDFKTMTNLVAHIVDLLNELSLAEKHSDAKIRLYRQELLLAKEIAAVRATSQDDSMNFLDLQIPAGLNNPLNYIKNWVDGIKELRDAMENNSAVDFLHVYNMLDLVNDLAVMVPEGINFLGMKLTGSIDSVDLAVDTVINSLGIDSNGNYGVLLGGLGKGLVNGANAYADGADTAIHTMAKTQIEVLDSLIKVFETLVALEDLGELDTDENGIFNLDDIFEYTMADGEKQIVGFNERFSAVREKIINAITEGTETYNAELKATMERVKINGKTLVEVIKLDAEDWTLSDAEVMNALLLAVLSKDYDLNNISSSLRKTLINKLNNGVLEIDGIKLMARYGIIVLESENGKYLDSKGKEYDTIEEAARATKLNNLGAISTTIAPIEDGTKMLGILKIGAQEITVTTDGENITYHSATLDQDFSSMASLMRAEWEQVKNGLEIENEELEFDKWKLELKYVIAPVLDTDEVDTSGISRSQIASLVGQTFTDLQYEWDKAVENGDELTFKAKYGIDFTGATEEGFQELQQLLNIELKHVDIIASISTAEGTNGGMIEAINSGVANVLLNVTTGEGEVASTPTGVTITNTVVTDTTLALTNIDTLTKSIENAASKVDTLSKMTIDKDTRSAVSSMDSLESATDSVISKINELNNSYIDIDTYDTVSNISSIAEELSNINKELNELENKEIDGVIKFTVESSGGASSAKGSFGLAFAAGKETLMGELGPELYVTGGHYYIAGRGGAEFVNLPDDAIVFNHLLTLRLLSSGSTGRGRPITNEYNAISMAHGTQGPAAANAREVLATLKLLRGMWESLEKMSVKGLLGIGGSKDSSENKLVGAWLALVERWYNLLLKIARLEKEINYQEALRSLLESARIPDGEAYYKSLVQSLDNLKLLALTYKELAESQEAYFKLRQTELNSEESPFSKYYTYDDFGLIKFNVNENGESMFRELEAIVHLTDYGETLTPKELYLKFVQAMGLEGFALRKSDGTLINRDDYENDDEFFRDSVLAVWERMEAEQREMQELYDSKEDNKVKYLNQVTEANKILQQIVDNLMAVENDILEAIETREQKIIDKLSDERQALADSSEKYIKGLQDALSKERTMYERLLDQNDLTKLQRQLSILLRSGGSASEIANLLQQISELLKDAYFSAQEDAINSAQEASDLQLEKLQKQIDIMLETLEYQKANGLLWREVIEIMNKSPNEIVNFITTNMDDWKSKSVTALLEENRKLTSMTQQWAGYRLNLDSNLFDTQLAINEGFEALVEAAYDPATINLADIIGTDINNWRKKPVTYKEDHEPTQKTLETTNTAPSASEPVSNLQPDTSYIGNLIYAILTGLVNYDELTLRMRRDLENSGYYYGYNLMPTAGIAQSLAAAYNLLSSQSPYNTGTNIDNISLNMYVSLMSSDYDAELAGRKVMDSILGAASRSAGSNRVRG